MPIFATNPLSWLFDGLVGNERVLDGAEWGASGPIQGFNVYAVVEAQPIGFCLAVFQNLKGAPLGDASGAGGSVFVRDCAGADDGSRAKSARSGGMRNQIVNEKPI